MCAEFLKSAEMDIGLSSEKTYGGGVILPQTQTSDSRAVM